MLPGPGPSDQQQSQTDDADRPNFSLVQSNIFYVLYVISTLVPLVLDFWFQFHRNQTQSLSQSHQFVVVLPAFAINGLLWLDFNLQMFRRPQDQTGQIASSSAAGQISEMLGESTDCSACLLAAPFLCLVRKCTSASSQHESPDVENVGEVDARQSGDVTTWLPSPPFLCFCACKCAPEFKSTQQVGQDFAREDDGDDIDERARASHKSRVKEGGVS